LTISFFILKTQFNVGVVSVGMTCNHLNQLRGIQECFIALIRNREIAHTWTDLNVADWDVDVEEVLQHLIQNDGCVDLYS
jgi:hypothetical protein